MSIQLSIFVAIFGIIAICNFEGLMLDVVGEVVSHESPNYEHIKEMEHAARVSSSHGEL